MYRFEEQNTTLIMNQHNSNSIIYTIVFLLFIPLLSCKQQKQKLDSKVRNLIESEFSSKQNLFIIDHIKYIIFRSITI